MACSIAYMLLFEILKKLKCSDSREKMKFDCFINSLFSEMDFFLKPFYDKWATYIKEQYYWI